MEGKKLQYLGAITYSLANLARTIQFLDVGLSEEVRMTDAVSDYVKKSRDYLEYLHWNNSNCLNGFIDHDKNIYVMNDEYYGRKSICDQIYDK